PTIPELLAARPDLDVLARTTVNPWDEPRFTRAVEALGRKKLIIGGVSTEVCMGLTAIRAVSLGYEPYGVVDASGTFSVTKRETGLLRLTQAGVLYQKFADEFARLGAQLLGISVDSVCCHAAFAREARLRFPLLADFQPRGRVARLYGVY